MIFIKSSSRYYAKFNTDHYEWNISGIVDIYNIYNVMNKLRARMLVSKNPYSHLQISIWNGDKCYTINLLIRDQVHDIISELINIFLDYDNVDINDIMFTLLHIKLPEGAGRSSRSIINISNNTQRLTMYN